MTRLSMIAVSIALIASPAWAEDTTGSVADQAPPQADPQTGSSGRYSFSRVDNGVLRLDNQTGQVTFCSAKTVGWACEAVAEDRAALDKEIGRLADENAALKKQLAGSNAPAVKESELRLKMPSNEDLQRAKIFIESTWQRLVDMLVTMQKDMQRRG